MTETEHYTRTMSDAEANKAMRECWNFFTKYSRKFVINKDKLCSWLLANCLNTVTKIGLSTISVKDVAFTVICDYFLKKCVFFKVYLKVRFIIFMVIYSG